MKKILILIISIGLIFGLVGIGTQAYFSDVKTSSVNIFTAGVWEYIITALAGDGGSIDPSGEIPVNKGNNQTFNITPDEGFVIGDVLVDGTSVGAVASHTFADVQADHSIHATFAPLTWDKSSLGFTWAGTIDSTQVCATVKNGDVSEAMQGEVDWELHYVKSGQAPGPNNDKEANIIARGKIPALFQGDSYKICWLESDQVDPGIDIGIYKFKAYQRPGHPGTDSFWSDKIDVTEEDIESGDTIVNKETATGKWEESTVTDTDTASVTLVKPEESVVTYTITATANAGGSIEPSGGITAPEEEDKTFTIIPDDGYKIADVEVDGKSVDVVSSYQFTNVTQNHAIHATFEKIEYTIAASAGEGGSIDPSGGVTVNEGDNQTFNITPNAGYEIDDVSVDGELVGAVDSYTFENVTGDHSIHAIFAEEPPITYTITATKEGNGSISDEGVTTLNEGESKTYNITPDTDYVIADLEVDEVTSVKEDLEGPDEYGGGTYTFTNVTQNHTIHATFEEDTNG